MGQRTATFALVATVSLLLSVACVASGSPLFAQNWRDLGPKERYNALRHYRQHEQLPPDRREEIEKRYERWQGMPPDERERIRRNYERLKQLPPRERERFEQRYQKWKRQAEPPQ